MRRMMVLLIFGLSACINLKSSDPQDLDVKNDQTLSHGKISKDPQGLEETPSKPVLSPEAVTHWQAFFKTPPSQTQRKILDQKIALWRESKSTKELLQRARAELALGRIQAAESTFRQVLRQSSDNQDALLELANIYLHKKDMANTFDILSQIKDAMTSSEKVAPEFVLKYRYTLAQAYMARGDRTKGHSILSDLIGYDRSFTPAYISLATSYLDLGKDQVAEFVVRRGIDRVKDSPGLLNIMGLIAQRSGQNELARTWFDKALAASPTYAPALVNRAVVSSYFLEYGAAEEDLMTAIQSEPTNIDAYIVLAATQKKQGNLKGAKASLTKALDLDSMNPYARFNLGVLQADDLKNHSEALRLFNEVLETQMAPPALREITARYIRDLDTLRKS
jgi:tetratricopeptide (TPR) repeat protein